MHKGPRGLQRRPGLPWDQTCAPLLGGVWRLQPAVPWGGLGGGGGIQGIWLSAKWAVGGAGLQAFGQAGRELQALLRLGQDSDTGAMGGR